MSYIAHKCAVLTVSASLLGLSSFSVSAEPAASTVSRLYKDYAWQAIISVESTKEESQIFGKGIALQPRRVLEQYFDPKLSSLIAADAQCAARTKEICKLDFDPIFASQDPAATDLKITSSASGNVRVEYTYPASGEKVRLDYRLSMIEGHWRISDIVYTNNRGASLRSLLESKPSK